MTACVLKRAAAAVAKPSHCAIQRNRVRQARACGWRGRGWRGGSRKARAPLRTSCRCAQYWAEGCGRGRETIAQCGWQGRWIGDEWQPGGGGVKNGETLWAWRGVVVVCVWWEESGWLKGGERSYFVGEVVIVAIMSAAAGVKCFINQQKTKKSIETLLVRGPSPTNRTES
jgi:hypothetical protein